ncbi:MAG: hypothetical protein JXR25_09910 [Pontiellaceae bacterium]|nr:hypothetical protein [Pontiellaceae bacterium]MBN2785132.1 hypothetical protein [Pontiellaceae bacterium]
MKTWFGTVCAGLLISTTCRAVEPVELHWLAGEAPAVEQGVAFGVPWQQGDVPADSVFMLMSGGASIPVVSWPMAYWPDGSLKWSGHAATLGSTISSLEMVQMGGRTVPVLREGAEIEVQESDNEIAIASGGLKCVLVKGGDVLFRSLEIDGKAVGENLMPAGYVQDKPSGEVLGTTSKALSGHVARVVVESKNALRTVVKVDGEYTGGFSKDGIIPFSARLYFYAGSPSVKIVYTIRYEGDFKQDYIRGLGLSMKVPLREGTLNRHVLLAGADDGVWHEATRIFSARTTRLEPNKDENLRTQLAGQPLLEPSEYGEKRAAILSDLAEWDGVKLVQNSADSFEVYKRTGTESCWLKSDWGSRSRGAAFAGDTQGGVVWGLRDFWQTYPSAIEVDGMTTDSANMTMWLWAPDAPAMDLRHYSPRGHGLSASYEDYEEGHATPYGVARTFEMTLRAMPSVPAAENFSELADSIQTPALPVCSPEYYHSVPVFGRWSLPDSSTPSKKWVEDRLSILLDYLEGEIETRHWYGFWDYGDVMHQYDTIRHQWKYDIGGFAWANTELAPNLWLWISFLRTGDPEVFRMAEAMARHTSEVDMYHSGPMMGQGTRHNVSHWGGGSKEVRISQALFHRPYYYLTADERIGDVMASVADNELALLRVNPLRKVAPKTDWPTQARIGPDWFALAGNWFTAWERTGDPVYRDKIIAGMDSIVSLPYGLFTGPYMNYDPHTGQFGLINDKATAEASHMESIFGGAELMLELHEVLKHPAWDQAWLDFCERYVWSAEEWEAVGLTAPKIGAYPGWHARLTAFAAEQKQDADLGVRAWRVFLDANDPGGIPTIPAEYSGPVSLNPGRQMEWGSINHMSQWSLNAIELLELNGNTVPNEMSGVSNTE